MSTYIHTIIAKCIRNFMGEIFSLNYGLQHCYVILDGPSLVLVDKTSTDVQICGNFHILKQFPLYNSIIYTLSSSSIHVHVCVHVHVSVTVHVLGSHRCCCLSRQLGQYGFRREILG
jgi:hypothetical protein